MKINKIIKIMIFLVLVLISSMSVLASNGTLNFDVREAVTNQVVSNYTVSLDVAIQSVSGSNNQNNLGLFLGLTHHTNSNTEFIDYVFFTQSSGGSVRAVQSQVRFYYTDGTSWFTDIMIKGPGSTEYTEHYDYTFTSKNLYPEKQVSRVEIWHGRNSTLSVTSSVSAFNIGFFYFNYLFSDFPLSLLEGNYTVFLKAENHINHVENISIYENETINLNIILSDANLNLLLKNAWTNNNVNEFNGWISNNEFNFNQSFNITGGISNLPLKKDLNYSVFIESPIYSLTEANYKTIFLNETYQEETFYLYTENSIKVFIKDEYTGDLITENVTVLVNNQDFYQETFSTTTGSLFLENLTDNIYTLRFDSSSYSARSYSVSVTEKSTQELNVFLSNSTNTLTINVLDLTSATTLEGARVSMSRFLNGEFVTVESKLTDITGKAVLVYFEDTRYKFVISKDGYTSRTFELNPILLNEYVVRLEKYQTFPAIPQSFTVSVNFMPKYFYQGENNVTLFFNSPEGRFSEYGYSLEYPCNLGTCTSTYHNNNAIGEIKQTSIFIGDAVFPDTVKLTYYYTVVGGKRQTQTFNLPIHDIATPYTIFDNINNKYDLNTFERLVIVTLIILLVGGVAILTAGQQVGGVVIIMLFGLFSFIGFVPAWTIALVLLAGVTYISSDRVRG